MSTGVDPTMQRLSDEKIEQIRRQITRLFDEVAQLSEQDLDPPAYYGEFLQRVLAGVAAPAGAVWGRTPQGNFQLQYQINMHQVGLDKSEPGRKMHDELLRQSCVTGKSQLLPPHSGTGSPDSNSQAGNPTDYFILMVPIQIEKETVGLIEVWQDPRHNPDAMPGFLQFLLRMAGLASVYVRNRQLRHMVGQQRVWEDLEKFARQVHGSLNPTEVAYLTANEGRRLIHCDRVSVAVRTSRKTKIEAISGADVVEKRSNLVQLLCGLAHQVADWGERLVYQGTKDESLPPGVLRALDAYLAESNSKLLVIQPLRDEREKDNGRPARSTLIVESFEPPEMPQQLLSRLEVVCRHVTAALYNAVEHRRIPFRFIWMPLAKLQEGLGGKARTIAYSVAGGLLFLLLFLVIVPYPLKMDATGQLLPEYRRYVFSPGVDGRIVRFPDDIFSGADVTEGQELILMHDHRLELRIIDLRTEVHGLTREIENLKQQIPNAQSAQDKDRIVAEMEQKKALLDSKKRQLEALLERTNSIESDPGDFRIVAPIPGTILSWDFRENLTNRTVKSSEPLLRIGDKNRGWEVELKIPQRHIGQIKLAFEGKPENYELDVDLLLLSAPTKVYKGKLARNKIASDANPNRDDPNATESVVVASVRIKGPDIAPADQLPDELLLTGTEVHTKVRCGNKPMIYSLFYGVWEFFFEKVWFYF